ncbi:MAG: hypothetical protein PHT07_10205 [Paludibacter sp.]|nr:hypothetical protein [Paludibacter sp.]
MKTIYTVIVHLVFGGISSVTPFEDKKAMEAHVLEWVNKNCPEGVSFTDPYEGVEWFSENSDKVEEGITIDDYTLQPSAFESVSFKERIRALSENMAVGFYISDDEAPSFDSIMEAESVFDIATVWEPFEQENSDAIKNLISKDAERLEEFAEAVVHSMSIGELMDEVAQRAQAEGIVESRGNICLLSIKSMGDSEKDECERSGAWGLRNDDVMIDTDEYKGTDEYLMKAKAFGIDYVHGI